MNIFRYVRLVPNQSFLQTVLVHVSVTCVFLACFYCLDRLDVNLHYLTQNFFTFYDCVTIALLECDKQYNKTKQCGTMYDAMSPINFNYMVDNDK